MTKPIRNASANAQRFFGLHMVEGLAEYREPGKDPLRILIMENAIKEMDLTFAGKPVYVYHEDEMPKNLDEFRKDCDGVVIRSFFNKADGKHWVEFMAMSDQAIEAIQQKKWKLSNAYKPKRTAGGGQYHGVDYSQEIKGGEYEHLAIVPNPRYAESIILTPEEFKAYNEKKEIELRRYTNSKDKGDRPMLKLFKRTQVENEAEYEGAFIVLPKTGKEVSIEELVRNADKAPADPKTVIANDANIVEVGDEKKSVSELREFYLNAMKKKNKDAGDEDEQKEPALGNDDEDEEEEKEPELKNKGKKKNTKKKNSAEDVEEDSVENESDEEDEALENSEEDEKAKKKAKGKENFEKLKNAHRDSGEQTVIQTSEDRVKVGKSRYGSGA